MKRIVAACVLALMVASPVLAAVPVTGPMRHCMEGLMACHEKAAMSCCTASPVAPATPATPATAGVSAVTAAAFQQPGPVVDVSAPTGVPALPPSPAHGYQSGTLLSRLSTLLI